MVNKNREGALELSIGTIVVIVIGMSMLILGLVLVRTIFSGATQSIDSLNDQVQSEILGLFGDGNGNLVIKLGSADTAKVKPGSDPFKLGIGARHPDGLALTGRDSLQYKLTLADDSDNNCLRILGRERAENLFITRLNTWNSFDEFSGSTAFALVQVQVPSGTSRCTQKVNVDMKLKESQAASDGKAFILEVAKEGIF